MNKTAEAFKPGNNSASITKWTADQTSDHASNLTPHQKSDGLSLMDQGK
jgi:hypothetical protein